MALGRRESTVDEATWCCLFHSSYIGSVASCFHFLISSVLDIFIGLGIYLVVKFAPVNDSNVDGFFSAVIGSTIGSCHDISSIKLTTVQSLFIEGISLSFIVVNVINFALTLFLLFFIKKFHWHGIQFFTAILLPGFATDIITHTALAILFFMSINLLALIQATWFQFLSGGMATFWLFKQALNVSILPLTSRKSYRFFFFYSAMEFIV